MSPTVPRTRKSATRTILAVRLEGAGQDGSRRVGEGIAAFRGRVSARSEDQVLGELASPTDALHCAAAFLARYKGRGTLQVGVAAGEVVRQGRRLVGAAVEEAQALAASAPPGEVLFSEAIFLSMNRSEVRCEPFSEGERRVHRLLPDEALPNSQRQGTSLRVTAHRLGERFGGLVSRAAAPVVRRPVVPVVALLSLAVLLSLPTLLRERGYEERVAEAVAAQRWEEADALVGAWLDASVLEPMAYVWKGRILLEVGEVAQASAALMAGLDLDASISEDPEVAATLIRLLEEKGADTSWPARAQSPALVDGLFEATRSEDYWLRWNAAQALEEMGWAGHIDEVGLLLLDLAHPGGCGVRMRAARALAEKGAGDPRVLPALVQAREAQYPGAICNLGQILDETIELLDRAPLVQD